MKRTGSFVHGCCILLAGLLLAACGGGGGSGGITNSPLTTATPSAQAGSSELANAFAATLNGIQQTPPRQTSAAGSGTVVINPVTRQMTATLTTTGVAGIDAQIRQGQPNEIGITIFPMTETPRGSGIWAASATLTDAQVNAFRASGFYFNVSSTTFIDGEIRGQILPQTAGSSSLGAPAPANTVSSVISNATFLAALRGTQEVPPTTSAALGSGTLLVNPVTRQFSAAVTTIGIAGTAVRIYEAPPGSTGAIMITLGESSPGSGVWVAQGTLTDAQLVSVQGSNTYFNVHSAAFPNGEIRGQILPQQVQLQVISGVLTNTPITTTGTTGTIGTTGSGTIGTGTTTVPTLTGTGTGTTGAGTSVPTLTGTGTDTIGIGTTGTGTSGIGTTSTGTTVPTLTGTGTGTTGIGTFSTGLTGTGATGTGTVSNTTPSGTTGILIGL